MKQYLDLVRTIRDNGVTKTDRTGVGTQSIFGHQMRFDLADGFPLVTTKHTHLKSIIHELLWFLQGDTNIRYLKENSVRIWDEWSLKESEFGENFETRKLIYVEPRVIPYSDYYNPVVDTEVSSELGTKLKATWTNMISRCYKKDAHNYKHYGAVGVFVCERWHSYKNFVEDVQKLPNWKNKLNNWNDYSLDKDYYSSNCYSPETCLWLSKVENAMYGDCSTLIAITPDGYAEIYPSVNQAAKELDIKRNTLHRFGQRVPDILKGRNKVLKGWKFIILDQPFRYDYPKVGDLGPVYGAQWTNWGGGHITSETVLELVEKHRGNDYAFATELLELFKSREKNGLNQIANLIHMLKTNPDSRRLIVSAWNPALVDQMALPPCHTMFQFYSAPMTTLERKELFDKTITAPTRYWNTTEETVDEYLDAMGIPRNKLSCQLYQRSADVFLGVPFNIASYALLLMMVAQVTDHVPGEFIWTGGDCHLYSNHAGQVELLLTRQPHALPTMKINPDVKDLFGFQFSDFELVDYISEPAISAPVAV